MKLKLIFFTLLFYKFLTGLDAPEDLQRFHKASERSDRYEYDCKLACDELLINAQKDEKKAIELLNSIYLSRELDGPDYFMGGWDLGLLIRSIINLVLF
jgi:hypothetical protein